MARRGMDALLVSGIYYESENRYKEVHVHVLGGTQSVLRIRIHVYMYIFQICRITEKYM